MLPTAIHPTTIPSNKRSKPGDLRQGYKNSLHLTTTK